MRSCFLRAVLLSAAVVGIILVPALPAHAQCTHLGQQVVCPSGVATGSMSLFFTNGAIIWQTPTGSTTSSPRAGCCPPFTTPTPTATGLTPTTGAGQTAVSNAVRKPWDAQERGFLGPALNIQAQAMLEADASDRASREAELQRRTEVYRWWQERAEAAEREASAAEREVQSKENNINRVQNVFRFDLSRRADAVGSGEIDRLLWAAAYAEHRAREAEDRGARAEAALLRRQAQRARDEVWADEHAASVAGIVIADLEWELARAKEEARAARERAKAARRGAEETYRRLYEARGEAERQPTDQVQPAQPVQQAQQFTVYFSDHATGSEYLRGYLEARPVINQSDAANARPPVPPSP